MQSLAPGMQHGERSALGTEVARIAGDVAQGLGRGVEEDPVDDRLIMEGDVGDRCGEVKTTWK